MRINRNALFRAGQLVSAAAPPNRASATGWTKAVLRDVSGVCQPRETDSSLSHCTVFRYCNPGNFRKRLIFVLFVNSWNL